MSAKSRRVGASFGRRERSMHTQRPLAPRFQLLLQKNEKFSNAEFLAASESVRLQ